jgi:hypothetical protein
MDLKTRPQVASPTCRAGPRLTEVVAQLALLAVSTRAAAPAELGLRAARSRRRTADAGRRCSCCRRRRHAPAPPSRAARCGGAAAQPDRRQQAQLRFGFPVARALPLRLDETPSAAALAVADGGLELALPPHALRTLLLQG